MEDFMNEFKFKKHSKYTRSEVDKIVTGSDKNSSFNFTKLVMEELIKIYLFL